MALILTLHNNARSGRPEVRTLETGTMSIGRGPANDWVLQDPDLLLSKMHCTISAISDRYVLTDLSTNGVFVNGSTQRVERDGQVMLHDGDEFVLGSYVVRCSTVDELSNQSLAGAARATPQTSAPIAANEDPFGLDLPMAAPPLPAPPIARRPDDAFGGRGADPFGTPPGLDPFAMPSQGGLGAPPRPGTFDHLAPKPVIAQRPVDPFAAVDEQRGAPPPTDSFSGRQPVDKWAGPSQRDNVDPVNMAFAPPRALPGAPADIDFDALLGDEPLTPSGAGAGLGAPPHTPQAAPPMGRAPAPPFNPQDLDIDDLLGDTPPGAPPPAPAMAPAAPPPSPQPPAPIEAARPVASTAPPPAAATRIPSPFDEEDDIHPPMPAPAMPKAPEPAPVQAAAQEAERPQPAAPAATTPGLPAAAPGSSADAARLLAAFLAGAGVPDLDLSKQEPEAYFSTMGQLFRLMVESLRDVLMSRAEVKGAFGVEQTMLRARNNNALKFSVTPEDAVAAMLLPGKPGYLPPLRAAEEAFNDLRSHQLAVMAGVQTALMGLLKRFDPEVLETRLKKGSMLDTLLPASRKARYWELFCETYKDIAGEAEGDFQDVFGKEFARAYKEQESRMNTKREA